MVNIILQGTAEHDVRFLQVEAGVRYWEDATVNGVEDEDGALIPCRSSEVWKPLVDLVVGRIIDWPAGTTASIHYKVCDDGRYTLLDADGNPVAVLDGYVPRIMSPGGSGYGDYIIMDIAADGSIGDWQIVLDDFEESAEATRSLKSDGTRS